MIKENVNKNKANLENKKIELLEKMVSIGLTQIFSEKFKSEKEKLVFLLTDGNRSSDEIAKLLGMGSRTVREYWKKWKKMGLVKKSKHYKKMQKSLLG